jgi:hypothetical protein
MGSHAMMGINKGCIPNIVRIDEDSGEEYEVYMTTNGLEIDIENLEFHRKMQTIISFPASLVYEAMETAGTIYKKYFELEE